MIPDRRSGDGQEGGKTIQKYQAIYADPPWDYQQCRLSGSAKKHYPTMRIEELCALPVAEIADRDCALFLWATFPQLPEALRLIQAWGFVYKTVAFVWLKQNRKALLGSMGWASGPAVMRKSACLPQRVIRNASPPESISWSSVRWKGTAKSQTRYGRKLWS